MPMLIEALRQRRFKKVLLALQVGWNINERDPTNLRTPLIELSLLDEEEMAARLCKRFLDKGAKIGFRDKNGRNALLHACVQRRQKLVDILLNEDEELDLNDRDHHGNTALSLAVISGNFIVVRMLLRVLKRYKLSVDISNNNGETPLILASQAKNFVISEILISEGKASTEVRDLRRHLTAKEWESVNETAPRDEQKISLPDQVRRSLIDSRSAFWISSNVKQDHSGGSGSSLKIDYEAVKNGCKDNYKDDLIKLFNIYGQQLSSSYKPSIIPLNVKDESYLSDISVFQDGVDYFCPLVPTEGLYPETCSTIAMQNKMRPSISKTAQIPLSVCKLRRQSRLLNRETEKKNHSANDSQVQRQFYRRGSINVVQKLKVPVKKRYSNPLLGLQRSTNDGVEMPNIIRKLDALTEEDPDD